MVFQTYRLWYIFDMKTVVDYYAEWCGPCKQMKPIIAELEKEMEGKVAFKALDVDAPENQEVVMAAGVMSIPTFVIEDEEGNEVSRIMGARPKEAMVQWIEENS